QYARREGIPVGPGRGSGAGSLVAYVLGITNVCPMKYGLLFERFLNPERKTMPDLDIDFSDDGRERVISYVRQKYGETNVAQIITFGSLQARLVVRDVGRVLGVPLPEVDRLAKLIPREPGTSIASARRSVPELEQLYRSDPQVQKLLDIAQRLEGLKRHTGVHAAGIVIAKDDLTNYAPLGRGAKEVITTQFNDEALLKLGLLKIDFLGLRTLTVIHHTVQLVKARHDPNFDLMQIPLDDPKTFRLLQEARTVGIFQLESQGMRDLLRKLKPTIFEDIVALIALYRPGPMGAGMLDEFVRRKHHPSEIKYDHPLLEPILRDSYGICLYQEQVMQIAQEVAGFSPGQADILRRAMGKKIPEELERQREDFLKGAKQRGIDRRVAVKIFEQIVHFGGYGFNKSHSVVYGLISYQTAHLKANHPLEYMASLLTSEIGRSAVAREEESKLVHFLTEAEALGIAILPPDVQTSEVAFAIQEEGIRFGLLAVKNVGEAAAEAIVRARQQGAPFGSLEDLCRRVDPRQVNRKVLESLVKAGALDRLSDGEGRAQLYHRLFDVMGRASRKREEVLAGQGSLFDFGEVPSPGSPLAPSHASVPSNSDLAWPEHLLLSYEKEVLGFYLSGHPLAKYQQELTLYSTHHLGQLSGGGNGQLRIAGMIANVKRLVSKGRKEQYARCRFEDLTGEIDLVVFPRSYAEGMAKHLRPGEMVVVTGRVSRRSEEFPLELIAEEIIPIRDARERFIKKLMLKFVTAGLEDALLLKVKEVLTAHPGACQVVLQVSTPRHGDILIETNLRVKPTEGLLQSLERLLGKEAWKVQ
ncbi:MAG: DNA polymerase III subunit alpha, partial [Elusimicrobia bacterium]|nr:DNA polymerase III subunit alpha [Elusimicrobiota bacterium]